jgi:hypothetical protein
MIEELSKIRALRSTDFQRQDPLDSPKVTNPYVRLSKGPMREYEPESDRDALRQLGIDPPNRPLRGPHGENHRQQCETINDQILETIASQQPLAVERQKLNLMLQSGVAQPQERHKRQKYVCAQLRRKKIQLSNLWDEYEAVLERRTGQHFLDVQQDRSAKQIQDLFSLPRLEVEMQLAQWRSTRTDLLKERHTLHSYLCGISQTANKEPMELADVPLRQSLLAKRAGIDRQTDDLKHRIEEGDRILEGKRHHDGPCNNLENLVLGVPLNFTLGDPTRVLPQTRIRTSLQSTTTTTEGSYHLCHPCTAADLPSAPSSIGGTSFPSAPVSSSDNTEATQKFQAQLKNAQLPTIFNHWDGKNLLLAPTWAKTKHSAATLAIHNIFHTQTDELLTIHKPFYRTTPINGVNSHGMFEISTINPMEDYEVEIKRVSIAETSDDRATQHQTRQKIDFPVDMFSDFVYLLHQLEEHAFPPASADCNRTFSVLWKTDLKKYRPNSYAKLDYTMELQMVVLPGTTGTERMVRFTQFMNGKHTIVQFPWVHLNRIFKLFALTEASIKQANYAVNEKHRRSKAEDSRPRQGRPQPFKPNGHTGRNFVQNQPINRSGFHNSGRPSNRRSPDRKVQRSPDRRQRTPDRTRDRTPERRQRTPERLRRPTPPAINYQMSSHHTTRQQPARGSATATAAPRSNGAANYDHVYHSSSVVPWKAQ